MLQLQRLKKIKLKVLNPSIQEVDMKPRQDMLVIIGDWNTKVGNKVESNIEQVSHYSTNLIKSSQKHYKPGRKYDKPEAVLPWEHHEKAGFFLVKIEGSRKRIRPSMI